LHRGGQCNDYQVKVFGMEIRCTGHQLCAELLSEGEAALVLLHKDGDLGTCRGECPGVP
jgi:hypothetical protein